MAIGASIKNFFGRIHFSQATTAIAIAVVAAVIGICSIVTKPDLQPVIQRVETMGSKADSLTAAIATVDEKAERSRKILEVGWTNGGIPHDALIVSVPELQEKISALNDSFVVVSAELVEVAKTSKIATGTANHVRRNQSRILAVALGKSTAEAEKVLVEVGKAKTSADAETLLAVAAKNGAIATTAASVKVLGGQVSAIAADVNTIRNVANAAKSLADSAATKVELRQVARHTAAALGKVAEADTLRKATKAEKAAAVDWLASQ